VDQQDENAEEKTYTSRETGVGKERGAERINGKVDLGFILILKHYFRCDINPGSVSMYICRKNCTHLFLYSADIYKPYSHTVIILAIVNIIRPYGFIISSVLFLPLHVSVDSDHLQMVHKGLLLSYSSIKRLYIPPEDGRSRPKCVVVKISD
jgi:hypothetical protein